MTARDVGLPARHPAPGLPERVTIWEVGARDGLQNEPAVVPVGHGQLRPAQPQP
jgi:hydroxymethylglutaryl-CoA lyase